jgi:ferritin-like metal-binding protein YciE
LEPDKAARTASATLGSISIAGTRATQLGMKDAAALLDRTLQEEKETDALLSRLAQAKVSLKAA